MLKKIDEFVTSALPLNEYKLIYNTAFEKRCIFIFMFVAICCFIFSFKFLFYLDPTNRIWLTKQENLYVDEVNVSSLFHTDKYNWLSTVFEKMQV